MNSNLQSGNDDGWPKPDAGEDSTAEVSRAVTREQTPRISYGSDYVDSVFPVGDELHSRPGKDGVIIPVYIPRPCVKASPQAAIIDWLAFTLKLTPHYPLKRLYSDLVRLADIWVTQDLAYGWQGYKRRAVLGEYGMVAWGGESQKNTAYVSINAHGCALITDWAAIEEWIGGINASIRRVDLAHDDYSGEVWNIERLRDEYLNDGFCGGNGRKPSSMLIGDWDNGIKGRTYQIGSRLSGKLLRGYEKGKQLGEPDSPWFRLELELLAKNRLIPWNVLTQPGQYLAGSYPCLSSLAECPARIPTSIKVAGTEYEALLRHVRRQYGQAINLIYHVEQQDPARALRKIMRSGIPPRFIASLPFLLNKSSNKTHENPDAD